MARTWTPRQARYEAENMVVTQDLPGVDAIVRHYVLTRHGAVARTWLPGRTRLEDGTLADAYVNVALWRPANLYPQWQGNVVRLGGQWVAMLPDGPEVGRAAEYLHAEALLLPLRTRTRSHGSGTWPTSIRRELYWRRSPQVCPRCQSRLRNGICPRPEWHD